MPEAQDRRIPRIPRGLALGFLLSWCAFLLMTTVNPDTAVTQPPFAGFDKLAHGGGWLILGFLGTLLVDDGQEQVGVWVACCLFGVLTELGQLPIPGRTFEALDALFDAMGAGLGGLLCRRFGYVDVPAEEPEPLVDAEEESVA